MGTKNFNMSDPEWDAEDFVPKNATTANDKWEGEDEDDVKDNWFDEEEEENEDKPGVEEQVKKKKPVRDRIAEKEAQKAKEREERIKREQEEQERMKNYRKKGTYFLQWIHLGQSKKKRT